MKAAAKIHLLIRNCYLCLPKNRKVKKYCFIVNPLSGGKDKKSILEAIEWHRFPHEIRFTERPGHATEIARETDADIVVAVGGDGTVSEVAQGLVGTDKILGILPCGSGDGLALHLGISRKPEFALQTLQEAHTATMDYGLVDDRPFFCTTGVGLDAEVAWQFDKAKTRGLWTYISLAWQIWQHFTPDTYTIDIDGKTIVTPAVFVTVGNANQWGNQARICSLASVADGQLDLTIVKPFRTWEIPVLATKLLTGFAHTSRRTEMLRGKKIIIRRGAMAPAHYDGDPCMKGTEIIVQAVPAALRVIVPEGRKI